MSASAEDNLDHGLTNLLGLDPERYDADGSELLMEDSQFGTTSDGGVHASPDHAPLGVGPRSRDQSIQPDNGDHHSARLHSGRRIYLSTADKNYLTPPAFRNYNTAAGFLVEPGYVHMVVVVRRRDGKLEAEPGSLRTYPTPGGFDKTADEWTFRVCVEFCLNKWGVHQIALTVAPGSVSVDVQRALTILRSLALETATVPIDQVRLEDSVEATDIRHYRKAALAAARLLLRRPPQQ